jgi:hypothetical protein
MVATGNDMELLRWVRILLIGVAGTFVVSPDAVRAQTADRYDSASLARIRAALAAPQPQVLVPPPSPDVVPTFRVEVNQYFSMTAPTDEPPFDPTWGLPSAGELMMGGIGKVRSAVSGYRKRRAKGKARKEVDDALAEFCAVYTCPAQTTPQDGR